jgi:hypothetical protein
MKALSIRQPWAWLICTGRKDIENRNWHIHMKPVLNYDLEPFRIYVHAGKTPDCPEGIAAAWEILNRLHGLSDSSIAIKNYESLGRVFGAIIGEVTITGCVGKSDSLWFCGPYGFTLANPVLYDRPIPYKGQLGFFSVNLP